MWLNQSEALEIIRFVQNFVSCIYTDVQDEILILILITEKLNDL